MKKIPASKLTILDLRTLHSIFPSASLATIPGLISISSPTLKTPFRILPPATPPFKSSVSSPGRLISKDLLN